MVSGKLNEADDDTDSVTVSGSRTETSNRGASVSVLTT